eukprot:g27034.t1
MKIVKDLPNELPKDTPADVACAVLGLLHKDQSKRLRPADAYEMTHASSLARLSRLAQMVKARTHGLHRHPSEGWRFARFCLNVASLIDEQGIMGGLRAGVMLDKARVTVRGSEKEVAKCKQTVKAVVDGALSLATLGSLAGVKGLKAAEENEEVAAAPPGALPVSLPLTGAPSPAVLAAMAARPLGAGQLPPVPPPHLAAAAAAAVPGMPENQQMQANLNDYYARWWTSYTLGEDQLEEEKPKEQPLAFDKEVRRLDRRTAAKLRWHTAW